MMTRFLICLALVAILVSAVPVPQAQTFVSPILDHKLWIPIWIASQSKKGLANSWASKYLCDVSLVNATWQYTYYPAADRCGDVESVPMINSPQTVNVPIRNDSPFILVLNEPDANGVSVQQAVDLWRIIEAIYPDKRLVSPAPSHLHPEWLAQFLEACALRGCKMPSALAAHCYLGELQCETHVTNVVKLADQWGIAGGVWVTEFAFQSTTDLQKFIAWMEANPRITRYAYFTNRGENYSWPMALLDSNGTMTEYGKAYRRLQ